MLRSILVGLDGSAHADAAAALGRRWAKAADALLVGQAVVDEPDITAPELVPMGAAYFTGERDEQQLADARRAAGAVLDRFSAACADAGVRSKVHLDTGDPAEILLRQAQRYDLVVLGAETHFRPGPDGAACDTLDRVLHSPPRPVVAVPERLPGGQTVVIGYDGSLQAARTVAAFVGTGLARAFETVVVTIDEDYEEAGRIAGRAVEYLSLHGIAVTTVPVETRLDPAAVLLDHSARLDAQLLVMGAFGHSALREFFFGSTTRSVLRGSTVPVMLYHSRDHPRGAGLSSTFSSSCSG